jgi:quercetin dioxygenase-like cupin family protein
MKIISIDDLRATPGSVALFQGADHGAANSFFVVSSAPGRGADRHRHPYEEIFVILAGTIEVTLGDETMLVDPGSVVIVPPNTWHGFVNRSDFDASMVNIHDSATLIQENWDAALHSSIEIG